MNNNGVKFVRWSIFIWVVAIITSILGVMFFVQVSLMSNLSQMKSDISSIKTDIGWIKNSINKSLTIR